MPYSTRNLKSGTEKQPTGKVFGTDIPRTSGGHSGRRPGSKLRAGGPQKDDLHYPISAKQERRKLLLLEPWKQREAQGMKLLSLALPLGESLS